MCAATYPDVSRDAIKLLVRAEIAVSHSNWEEAEYHLERALDFCKCYFQVGLASCAIHPFEQRVRYLLGLASYQMVSFCHSLQSIFVYQCHYCVGTRMREVGSESQKIYGTKLIFHGSY